MRTRIKIIKASDSLFWYASLIGETLDVERTDSDRYWCREHDQWRCLNFVLKTDSEVVDAC